MCTSNNYHNNKTTTKRFCKLDSIWYLQVKGECISNKITKVANRKLGMSETQMAGLTMQLMLS